MAAISLWRIRARLRPVRMWEPTGRYELFWDQGGGVSLDGQQADRLSGKTRWRRADWLPLDEYHARIEDLLRAAGWR